jgi:hypothetical protein
MREFLSRRIFLKSLFFFVFVSSMVMFFTNKFEPEVILESTSNKFYTTNNSYSELEGFDKVLMLQNAFIRNAKMIKPAVVSINGLQQIKKVSWQESDANKFNWLVPIKDWFSNTFRTEATY